MNFHSALHTDEQNQNKVKMPFMDLWRVTDETSKKEQCKTKLLVF